MARQPKANGGRRITGVPTHADERRMRAARKVARTQVAAIDRMARSMRQAVFQVELASIVRSASPFLTALIESEGYSLAEIATNMEPMPEWPRRPRLAAVGTGGAIKGAHIFRHYFAKYRRTYSWAIPPRPATHGHTILRDVGGWIRVEVVGCSLEVVAQIGSVRFETQHGRLFVGLPTNIPDTLAVGCVGRLVETVVDHVALRGKGWTIAAVEDCPPAFTGQVLIVETGLVAFRIE